MLASWVLVALIAASVTAYVVRYRRRTAAVRRVAAAQGWSYTYARYPTFTRGLTAPPFDEAGRRSVRHVIEGTVGGRSFRAFDYWLTVGNYSSR